MKSYIEKSAVVAEIEKRKHKLLDHIICERDKEWAIRTAHLLNRIIWFIGSLEVRGVDLEYEIEKVKKMQRNFEIKNDTIIEFCAKHFFELGLKMKGGEE